MSHCSLYRGTHLSLVFQLSYLEEYIVTVTKLMLAARHVGTAVPQQWAVLAPSRSHATICQEDATWQEYQFSRNRWSDILT